MNALLWLQHAGDIAGEASNIGNGTILTAILGLTTTIFGALTITQKSQVDTLQGVITQCRSGRDTDVAYERNRVAAAETKEDKLLERLSTMVSSMMDLSNAVRENATVATALAQEVRNHANRVDAIIRTQDTMARDIADNKKALDELRRVMDDFRYRRSTNTEGSGSD